MKVADRDRNVNNVRIIGCIDEFLMSLLYCLHHGLSGKYSAVWFTVLNTVQICSTMLLKQI